jgi:hypothetical protein
MILIMQYLVYKMLLCLSDCGVVQTIVIPDMFLEFDSMVWH